MKSIKKNREVNTKIKRTAEMWNKLSSNHFQIEYYYGVFKFKINEYVSTQLFCYWQNVTYVQFSREVRLVWIQCFPSLRWLPK